MKNKNVLVGSLSGGFAPIFVLLAVVLVGGGVYALVPRETLKSFFQVGDKPTAKQFDSLIDSTLHYADDRNLVGLKEYDSTKEYLPGDTVVKSDSIYQAKVLTQDQKEFTLNAVQSVTFRWTPVVPKPQESVTYRLRVWQLMQGQNASGAMKTNKPIVTKDVSDVSEVTVSGIYTGPCRPPYLCDFVWSVEPLMASGAGTSDLPTQNGQELPVPSEGGGKSDGSY